MRYMIRRLKDMITAVLFIAAVTAAGPMPVQAVSNYGRGMYSDCSFQQSCPPAQPPVVMPSGLEVNINLADGQKIPDDEYQIAVTPLNGQGQTFQKVEFYVDGKLLATFLPDNNGTATYQWNTSGSVGNKRVKIIVYDKDGQSVTKQYGVQIVPVASLSSPTNTSGGSNDSGNSNPVSQIVTQITTATNQTIEKLAGVVRQIPKPVAATIPYAPLVILLGVVLLLLLQSRREAEEVRRLQMILARSKRLADEKDGFVQLASHYLRTPFTIVQGGADLLKSTQPDAAPSSLQNLSAALSDFGVAIESLLSANSSNQNLQSITQPVPIALPRRIWLMPSFIIPVVLSMIFVAIGNVLINRAHQIPTTLLSTILQLMLLIAAGIGLYVVVRALKLHQRDRQLIKQQESQEIAIDEARNTLIRDGVGVLSEHLHRIQTIVPTLPDGAALKLMKEGLAQAQAVLSRFSATATVIPPLSNSPFKLFLLSTLLTQSQVMSVEVATQKNIKTLLPDTEIKLASQQPSWITQILGTIIDNAVAYSPEGGQIEVTAKSNAKTAVITVRDHGPGVSADKLEELFQPFSKAEGAMQFDHPGLGLNLYLDRLLLTALGGSITLESRPEQGVLATVTFPIK